MTEISSKDNSTPQISKEDLLKISNSTIDLFLSKSLPFILKTLNSIEDKAKEEFEHLVKTFYSTIGDKSLASLIGIFESQDKEQKDEKIGEIIDRFVLTPIDTYFKEKISKSSSRLLRLFSFLHTDDSLWSDINTFLKYVKGDETVSIDSASKTLQVVKRTDDYMDEEEQDDTKKQKVEDSSS